MFKWKYTQGSSFLVLCPSARANQPCILAHFEIDSKRKPYCARYYATATCQPTSLKATVKQHRLRGLPTCIVLPDTDCHYRCLTKPDIAVADIPDITATHRSQKDGSPFLVVACDAPALLPKHEAQSHVFAVAEKKIADYVKIVHAAGLSLQSITVSAMALARFLATPAYAKLSLYIDRESGSVPMAHLFYDGAFIAVRPLPNIVPESDASILSDQCLLFAQACQAMIQPYENALHCQAGVYFSEQLARIYDQRSKAGRIFSACCPFVKPLVIQATDWLACVQDAPSVAHVAPALLGGGLMYA